MNTILEVESAYSGGPSSWSKFLSKNIQYPEDALKKEIQGSVVVRFMVDIEGRVSNVEAVSGPVEFRKEAIRLIKRSGQWIPVVYHGIKVKTYKMQPFVFWLQH